MRRLSVGRLHEWSRRELLSEFAFHQPVYLESMTIIGGPPVPYFELYAESERVTPVAFSRHPVHVPQITAASGGTTLQLISAESQTWELLPPLEATQLFRVRLVRVADLPVLRGVSVILHGSTHLTEDRDV